MAPSKSSLAPLCRSTSSCAMTRAAHGPTRRLATARRSSRLTCGSCGRQPAPRARMRAPAAPQRCVRIPPQSAPAAQRCAQCLSPQPAGFSLHTAHSAASISHRGIGRPVDSMRVVAGSGQAVGGGEREAGSGRRADGSPEPGGTAASPRPPLITLHSPHPIMMTLCAPSAASIP